MRLIFKVNLPVLSLHNYSGRGRITKQERGCGWSRTAPTRTASLPKADLSFYNNRVLSHVSRGEALLKARRVRGGLRGAGAPLSAPICVRMFAEQEAEKLALFRRTASGVDLRIQLKPKATYFTGQLNKRKLTLPT